MNDISDDYICCIYMPIRQGKAKLWFNTKQEQDQYDDNVISNIQLTTDVESDDNYCLMFVRKKKQQFLTLNSRAKQQNQRINAIYSDQVNFIDKYLAGKRDHTINREWIIHKNILGWGVGYLLLRELPIRNFYARCWIMLLAYSVYAERNNTYVPFQFNKILKRDQFTDKTIRNYQAYFDMNNPIIPLANNKIPESKVWEMNQPAYLREYPIAKMSEMVNVLFPVSPRTVAWDGTFNMPLEGLAHPLHKDGKFIDFVWWEY